MKARLILFSVMLVNVFLVPNIMADSTVSASSGDIESAPYLQRQTQPNIIVSTEGFDTDGDWIMDSTELEAGTDPNNIDSDSDGLSDFEEIHIFHSDPVQEDADSDSDGFADTIETKLFHTKPTEVDLDSDGDLVPDSVELEHGTDPKLADTDGDSLSDLLEIFLLNSDPLTADKDSDGDRFANPLEQWLPPALADETCGVTATLELNSMFVNDPEEADGQSLMGGDEAKMHYLLVISNDNRFYGMTNENNSDDPNYRAEGNLWEGEGYSGSRFIDFQALGPLTVPCGYFVDYGVQLIEEDAPFGETTDMGVMLGSLQLTVSRIPLGWQMSKHGIHNFNGLGIDGLFDYELDYSLVIDSQPAVEVDATDRATELTENPASTDQQNKKKISGAFSKQVTFGNSLKWEKICQNMTQAKQGLPEQTKSQSPIFQLGQTLVIEEFDDNQRKWVSDDGSYQLNRKDLATIETLLWTQAAQKYIEDGGLWLKVSKFPAGVKYHDYAEPAADLTNWANATQNSFEVEAVFDSLSTSTPRDLEIALRLQRDAEFKVTFFFYVYGDQTWDVQTTYGDVYHKGDLPDTINLLDGKQHSMKWHVENLLGSSTHTLIVDDVILATFEDDAPFHGPTKMLFGLRGKSAIEQSGQMRIDRLQVHDLVIPDLKAGAGVGALSEHFTSEHQRFSFDLPAGWYSAPMPSPVAWLPTGDVNNFHFYNKPTGFSGGAHEMSLNIYEPVYVMEETKIVDSSQALLSSVLRSFLENTSSASTLRNLSTIHEQLLCERPVAVTMEQKDGAEVVWLALRNSDQSVTIIEAQTAPGEFDQLHPTLLTMANTVDYVTPPRLPSELGEPALATKVLTILTTQLQRKSVADMLCFAERLSYNVFEDMASELNPIRNMIDLGYEIDDSYRYYEVVITGEESGIGKQYAFVRVSGNVIFVHADGRQVIKSHSELPFTNIRVVRLEYELGQWRPCIGMY